MYPDSLYAEGRGSFLRPVPQPVSAPGDSPTTTVTINCEWLPYIRGALQQLLLQATWQEGLPGLDITQGRAFDLIDLFQECADPVPPFVCIFDFTDVESGSPWTEFSYGALVPPLSHFQTGVGWNSVSALNPGGPENFQTLDLKWDIGASVDIYIVQVALVDYTIGDGPPVSFDTNPCYLAIWNGGALVDYIQISGNLLPAGDSLWSHDFGGQTTDRVTVQIVCGFDYPGDATGQAIIAGISVTGHALDDPCD